MRIAEDEWFVICFNPEAAERDAAVRARTMTQLEEAIRDSDQLSWDKRAELRGVISTKPGLNRYLRVTPGGLARHEAGHRPAPGLPPPRGPDPRPRRPVLAGASPRPRRRERLRSDLAELRRELDRIHVGTFTGPAGTFRQRTEITKSQLAILKALHIDAPPRTTS